MSKAKGTRNEHKTMRYLEALGYACTRAAASLGLWDVIAVSPHEVKLVQVKTNRWAGTVETEQMVEFRVPHHVSKELWRWDDYARQPKVKIL